jgi:hypothetical protein
MRRLLVILAVVAAILTAAWFAVARGVDGSLRAWFAARTAEGWVAEYASLGTTGFPRRFRTVLTDVTLADPETGLAWSAPRFAFEAAAFRPHRITARWPAEQTIASPWERIEVVSDRFDAAVAFVPGTRLEIREIEVGLRAVALRSSLGWTAGFGTGALSATARDGEENAYRIGFEARDLTLPEDVGGASTRRVSCPRSSRGSSRRPACGSTRPGTGSRSKWRGRRSRRSTSWTSARSGAGSTSGRPGR